MYTRRVRACNFKELLNATKVGEITNARKKNSKTRVPEKIATTAKRTTYPDRKPITGKHHVLVPAYIRRV